MQLTAEQLKELYRVSAELTAMYVSIHLVRRNVIVLAGDGIDVYIYPNGEIRIT